MKTTSHDPIEGRTITRASVLAMASGAAVMGAITAPAWAQTMQALRVGVLPVEAAAGASYATNLGYFAKAGLDVTLTTMSNTPSIVAAVVAGALDIGYTTIDSVASIHAHNIPLVVIAPATDYIDPLTLKTAGVLVRPDSTIRTARDLSGKTIASPALHSLGTTGASAWIDANGGDSSTVSYVEIPFPAQPAALALGRVDGIFEVEPFFSAAAKNARVLFNGYSAISKHFLLNLWVTTPDWAKAHSDLVSRFVSVMHETAVWANKNHDQSGPMLAKFTNIPADVIAAMVRSHYAEELTPAIMQPGIDASAKYNNFPTFPAATLLLSQTR
jgi:NitT/TauT family transport system substrate-binding protein